MQLYRNKISLLDLNVLNLNVLERDFILEECFYEQEIVLLDLRERMEVSTDSDLNSRRTTSRRAPESTCSSKSSSGEPSRSCSADRIHLRTGWSSGV